MQKRFKILIILSVLLIGLVIIFYFVLRIWDTRRIKVDMYQSSAGQIATMEPTVQSNLDQKDCVTKIEKRLVRGDSLKGLIEPGTAVELFYGYYSCHEPQRDEVIFMDFPRNDEPIIKILKGLPGDRFGFKKNNDVWEIIINDEILKNSLGELYEIDDRGHNMLALYEHDYAGLIPKDVYMVLGNLPGGTLDSTKFGLVGKNALLGKINY